MEGDAGDHCQGEAGPVAAVAQTGPARQVPLRPVEQVLTQHCTASTHTCWPSHSTPQSVVCTASVTTGLSCCSRKREVSTPFIFLAHQPGDGSD